MSPYPPVLLPTGYSRTEYVVLRSLARQGVPVHVADSRRAGMAQWSRLARSVHRRVSSSRGAAPLADDISRIAMQAGARVVLPTDALTMLLAQERRRLDPSLILPVVDAATMAIANNKSRVAEVAIRAEVTVPLQYPYADPADIERTAPAASRLVVKLPESAGSQGVYFVRGGPAAAEQCRRLIERHGLTGAQRPIVQAYQDGEGWGVSALYWHGEAIATFTHRRLREKAPSGGTSTLRASARAPQLEAAAHRLLRALNWHGLAMVEFKYDLPSGRYWLLEVNPRVWGSIALPVGCGIDFPFWLYLCAIGDAERARDLVRAAGQYPEGILARWVLGDVVQFFRAIARARLKDGWSIAFGVHADIHDDIDRRDLRAFLGELAAYAVDVVGK